MRYPRGSDNLAADRLSRSAAEYDVLVNNEVEFFERHVYPVLDSDEAEANHSHKELYRSKLKTPLLQVQ